MRERARRLVVEVRYSRPVAVRVLWLVKGLGPGGAERLLVEAARAHDLSRVQLTCAFVLPWKDHLVAELEAAGCVAKVIARQTRTL